MKKTFILLFLAVTAYRLNAQDTLIGPHGGRIKITKDYRLETLGCDNYLEIYLFNEAGEPVFNNGINGAVTFYYDKDHKTCNLNPYGIDGFTAKIERPDFSHYVVTMNLLDRLTISASYNECVMPKQ